MKYKEYTGYTKTFIVVHNTGFGVQEASYQEQGIVYETDNEADAYKKADELRTKNNSAEDLKSSWAYNAYQVNINTLTEQGKEFLKKFESDFEESLEKIKSNPNYILSIDDFGNNWHGIKNDKLDTNSPNGDPLVSYSFYIFDVTKDSEDGK